MKNSNTPRPTTVLVLVMVLLLAVGLLARSADPENVEVARQKLRQQALERNGVAKQGAKQFAINCSNCHGNQGKGSFGPALTGLGRRLDKAATIDRILNPQGGRMPKGLVDSLSPQELTDLVEFVRELK